MNNLRFYKIFVVSIIVIMFTSLSIFTTTATGTPLLLLNCEEIDSEHFTVTGTFSDIPEVSVISIPMAFNNENVAVCGYDESTGEFFDIPDGTMTAGEIREGEKGLKIYDCITSKDGWSGMIIANDYYPYVSNAGGLITATFYTLKKNVGFTGENKAFSVSFKRLNDGPAEIRSATQKNAKVYDEAAARGMSFLIGNEYIDVKIVYTGDVFSEETDVDFSDVSEGHIVTENAGGGSYVENEESTGWDESKENKNSETDNSKTENEAADKGNTDEKLVFTDISDSHWAYTSVKNLVASEIINGYSDNSFKPENFVTRAELTKIVVCAKNEEIVTEENLFADVSADSWYSPFVSTGYKNSIINGYPDKTFKPDSNITREDLCTVLYRAFFGNVAEAQGGTDFSDSEKISEYAKEAVEILNGYGIVNGRNNNEFYPKDYATRAETAKVIYLCMEKANEKN